MNRSEIIVEMGKHIPFFQERWTAFCERVEEYAEELYRLEREAGEKYEKELDDEEFKKWREAQVAPHRRRLKQAEKVRDLALEKSEHAEDEYNQVVARIHPEWASLPREQLFLRQLPADLSSRRDQIAPYHEKAREARKAYLEALDKAYELAKLADPHRYSPQSRAKSQNPGPASDWTEPGSHGWLTHYLKPPKEDRRLDHRPTDPVMKHGFYRPATLVNPASWFGVIAGCPDIQIEKLPPKDQNLKHTVLLSVVHDDHFKGKGAVDRIYLRGTYPKDSYFMADAFVDALATRLRQPDSDTEIGTAWKALLPQNKKRIKRTITAFVLFLAALLTVLQILFGWTGIIFRFLTSK